MAKKELEEIAEIAATKAVGKAEQKFERYVSVLKEDFDHKLDVVLERLEVLPAIQQKIDMTFEKVGELAVDTEVVKDAVKNHDIRLQRLESR